MSGTEFTEDHLDALRETTNLAMGEAGADLAGALDSYIELSVPELKFVSADTILHTMSEYTKGFDDIVSVVRQGFDTLLEGESLLVFNEAGLETVDTLLGDDEEFTPSKERELLLDMTNIISGACLGGLGKFFNGQINVSRPSIFCQRMPYEAVFDSIFNQKHITFKNILLINISFSVEGEDFKSDLFIFLSESSMNKLRLILDNIMDQI